MEEGEGEEENNGHKGARKPQVKQMEREIQATWEKRQKGNHIT